MRRSGLPAKYRIWLFRVVAVCSVVAAGGWLLSGDPVSAVSAALIGVWAGLAAYDFDTSPHLGRRLLVQMVAVVVIVLSLYRLLFTFATTSAGLGMRLS